MKSDCNAAAASTCDDDGACDVTACYFDDELAIDEPAAALVPRGHCEM